jgi:hypothetical protein
MCGPPAWVRFDGHVGGVGDCAGLLLVPAVKITVHVGQRIDVHMTEGSGPHGNRWVPAIPLPRSSRPSVVLPGAISPDRATETYRAARPGHAALASHTWACLVVRHRQSREVTGNCPVVEITVVP